MIKLICIIWIVMHMDGYMEYTQLEGYIKSKVKLVDLIAFC